MKKKKNKQKINNTAKDRLKQLNNTPGKPAAGDIERLAASKLAKNINEVHAENLSQGDKLADALARFAGSWTFIIAFAIILLAWVALNSIQLVFHPFDPFPFILLNLVLSCIAAIQAPVIMMSQNRHEEKDRLHMEHDYEINLKSEVLIEEILQRLKRMEEEQGEIKKLIKAPKQKI